MQTGRLLQMCAVWVFAWRDSRRLLLAEVVVCEALEKKRPVWFECPE